MLLDPVVTDVTVREGEELRVRCTDTNVPGLSTARWLDSEGNVLPINAGNEYVIMSVARSYSGAYTCQLTSNIDNSTAIGTASITVQCEFRILPEAT